MKDYLIPILTVAASAILGMATSAWRARKSASFGTRLEVIEREQLRRTRILDAMEAYADETLADKLRHR